MSDTGKLGPWVRRFLLEHLVSERNLARNTQRSYRDTLALLIPFIAKKIGIAIDHLKVFDVTADLVRAFLAHIEETRGCSVTTRNQRLAAMHALGRFVAQRSPEHIEWCGQIRNVPFKKAAKTEITYLEKPEMDALLAAPDLSSPQGRRDHALLLFLYNTGARADEATQVTIADMELSRVPEENHSLVKIHGKGNKWRRCPIWPQTVRELIPLIRERNDAEHVFLNRRGHPITRFGIYALVKRHVNKAAARMPSLTRKQVSPHSIRHTTATHLLRAGVDINTIRAWLGHVSLNTTNIYAEIDLETKARALAHCELKGVKPTKQWAGDKGLIAFLQSL